MTWVGSCMPRLTKSELARHRAWLSDWRTPADMAAYVSAVNNAMGAADFFRQGGVESLRRFAFGRIFGANRTTSSGPRIDVTSMSTSTAFSIVFSRRRPADGGGLRQGMAPIQRPLPCAHQTSRRTW